MKHSKEPWRVDDNEFPAVGNILCADGETVCQACERKEARGPAQQIEIRNVNARRIVLCVNACEGIEDDVLSGAIRGIDSFKTRIEQLENQRDEMLDLLKWFCKRVDNGEVRSVHIYQRFQSAITRIEANK